MTQPRYKCSYTPDISPSNNPASDRYDSHNKEDSFIADPTAPKLNPNKTERMASDLPKLSLYVHIPWCVQKCPYCDFNSHNKPEKIPEQEYLKALKRDLFEDCHALGDRKLTSIFFGGGTPSLFSANAIAAIINMAEERIGFEHDIEITLEANPGTSEYTDFSALYDAGVNRLSLGVQSFNHTHLAKLGRIHQSDEVYDAYKKARAGGFSNINLDLMHGLPKQNVEEASHDLQCAIALKPEHISWYQLTLEPNTVFYNKPPPIPNDDILADIQDAGETILQTNGYKQYEVSAYSKAGKQARHNLNYWQFGDYLGIGAGAHSKITRFSEKTNELIIERYRKTRLPSNYMSAITSNTVGHVQVPSDKRILEFMMNALRLPDGVEAKVFEKHTGLNVDCLHTPLHELRQQGLLENTPERLQTTELGFRFLNSVLSHFEVS